MAKRFVTTKVEIEGREETKVVELPSRNPEPWGEDAELHVVGQRVPRMDALEKVTGSARYTADVAAAGNALRRDSSRRPFAAARVDVARPHAGARARRRARRASTLDDVPDVKIDGVRLFDHDDPLRRTSPRRDLRRLARDRASARCDAIRLRRRRREPHAVDRRAGARAERAARPKPSGNTARGTRRASSSRGDVDAGLRDADVTITREYRTPVALHTALEPHGAVAEWSGGRADRLRIDARHLHDARARSRRRSACRSPTCASSRTTWAADSARRTARRIRRTSPSRSRS